MDYADELCRYFMEANEAEAEPEPKEVKIPASARTVFIWRDPRREMGEDVTVEVRATKARWFVWRFGRWAVRTETEARLVIDWATERRDRRLAEMARAWTACDILDRKRATILRRRAEASRDALLADIEEAALRMTLKAKSLEERMAINDEKERLEEEVSEAFDDLDEDEYKFEAPDLPYAWRIVAAKPSRAQFNLNF